METEQYTLMNESLKKSKGRWKIARIKWKQKHSIPECLGYNEDSSKKKVIGMSDYT